MNEIKKILPFARPSVKYLVYNFLFNIFFTLFSLFSIGTILPILRILFLPPEKIISKAQPESSLGKNIPYLEEAQNYFSRTLSSLIAEEGASYTLAWVCVLCVMCFFFKNLSKYFASFFVTKFNNSMGERFRNALHHKMLNLNVSFYGDRKSGDIISRSSIDIGNMQSVFQMATEMVIREPLLLIFTVSVLIYMSPQLTLFVVVILPLSGLVISRVTKSLKASSMKAQVSIAEIMSRIQELIHGFSIIKSFNAEKEVHQQFKGVTHQYKKFSDSVDFRQQLASPFSEFAGAVTIMLTLWFGGVMVLENRSGLSPEAFIIYIVYFFQIVSPIKNLLHTFYHIKKISPSIDRYFEVIDLENPIKEPEHPKPIDFNFNKISFEKVDFSYEDRASKKVLSDLSFDINRGDFVAIVGSSGSGKSTVSKLLVRFYDVLSGKITIDGNDLRDYNTGDLRRLTSVVNQEIILFNATIFENVVLGRQNTTESEVLEALKKANAYDFVMETPLGLQTIVGDNGLKLSGGQRQRLCIARAIIKNAPFLILDEATSALDTISEKLVQQALSVLMEGRTSLVIAHRLSTVQNADKIIVLEDGKICEQGTPKDLLQNGKVYRNMVNMQSLVKE